MCTASLGLSIPCLLVISCALTLSQVFAHDAGSACSLVLQVATLRTAPASSSSPCDAGTGDNASPASADPVAHTAGEQQPPRAGSSAAEATKLFLSPLPVEGQVKQVSVEEEVGIHSTTNARSHGHVNVDPRTKRVHAVSDGAKTGKGGSVLVKSSGTAVKQQGNAVLAKITTTCTTSNPTGGVKTISYAQALKSFVSSPEQAALASSSRSHVLFESSLTDDAKDRSCSSSRSSTPQVTKPISSLEPKDRANVMLQVPSEGSSRTHSALSNVADVSSESGQSEGVQAPGRSSASSHPPTPDVGKPRVAAVGSVESQPFPSTEMSCGLNRLSEKVEQRSVGSPLRSQGASSLELKLDTASSAEPTLATKDVPNSATKVQVKRPSLPPGFAAHASPQHNLRLGPQPPVATQHVTVFPQAVSDVTPTDASQPFSKKEGGIMTSLHSGGAPPSNPHDSKAQAQFPIQTPFRSAELRTLDQAVRDESLHTQRLQIQQSLPHYEQQKGAFVSAHSAISHLNKGLPPPHQHLNAAPPLGAANKPLITSEHSSEGQPRPIDSQSPAAAVGIIHSPRAVKPSPTAIPPPPPGLIASFTPPMPSPSAGLKDATSAVQARSPSAFSPYQKAHPVPLPVCNSPRDLRPVGELADINRQAVSEGGEDRTSSRGPLSGGAEDLQHSESNKPPTILSITAPPFVPSGTQTPVSHSTPTSGFATPYSMPELIPSGFHPYPLQHFKNSVVSAVHETGGNGLHVTPRQPPGFDRPVVPAVPAHHIPPVVLDPVRLQMIQRAQAAAHAQAMAGLAPSPALIKQPPHPGVPSPEALALMVHQLAINQQLQQQYPPHTHPPPPNPTAIQRKSSLQHMVANPAVLQHLHSEATPPSAVQVIMPQAMEMIPHKNHEQMPPGLSIQDTSQVRKSARPYITEYPGILAMAPTSGIQTRSLLPNTRLSVPAASLAPYTVRGVSAHDMAILPPPDAALATQALLMQPKVTPSITKRRPLLPTPPALSLMSSNNPFSARLPVHPPQGLQVPFPMAQDQQRSSSLYAFNPAAQY